MSARDAVNKPALPEGWSDARVADVIAHYQTQSEDEAVAEDEAALSRPRPDGHGDSDRSGAGCARVALGECHSYNETSFVAIYNT